MSSAVMTKNITGVKSNALPTRPFPGGMSEEWLRVAREIGISVTDEQIKNAHAEELLCKIEDLQKGLVAVQ